MNKLDNIFLKIIKDPQFSETIGNDAFRVNSLNDGKRSMNKQIKAIAEILDQLNKAIQISKSEMRLKSGKGVIAEAEYQAIYRKVVSLLIK